MKTKPVLVGDKISRQETTAKEEYSTRLPLRGSSELESGDVASSSIMRCARSAEKDVVPFGHHDPSFVPSVALEQLDNSTSEASATTIASLALGALDTC